MNKSQLLRSLARKAGLCDKWYSEWKDSDTDEILLDKFIRGQDFCIKHDYPSLDVIRSTFDDDTLRKHNIYLDARSVVITDPTPTCILLGNSKASVFPAGFSVSDIYVRHNSTATIHATGHAIVAISVFDSSCVKVSADPTAKVRVYKKSKNASVEADGDVIIRD